MISHDTQLCLTEPEARWREREGVIERERGETKRARMRERRSRRERETRAGSDADTQLFLRGAGVHSSQAAAVILHRLCDYVRGHRPRDSVTPGNGGVC